MPMIVPTITAENPHVYREQIERVQAFAKRLHIDLMDGVFTPNKSVAPEAAWWPEGTTADIHLMFQQPAAAVAQLVKLKPNLIIIPAESNFNFGEITELLQASGTKLGIALLPETNVESVEGILQNVQQLLIFSGNLGHQGGSVAKLDLLDKVAQAQRINPELEIAWDGGVNEANAAALAAGGINVLNVGGALHTAPDAGLAYQALTALLP